MLATQQRSLLNYCMGPGQDLLRNTGPCGVGSTNQPSEPLALEQGFSYTLNALLLPQKLSPLKFDPTVLL